jgi:hypothetical protein
LGCALNPKLPDQVLTDLATNGFLQRRRHQRRPIDVAARMRCEGILNTADVQIVDVSAGGFRVRSTQEAGVGRRILLQLDSGPDQTDLLVAQAAWQMRQEDEYEVGCAFVNKQGPQLLHDVLQRQGNPDGDEAPAPRKRSSARLLTLALLLAALALAYTLMG